MIVGQLLIGSKYHGYIAGEDDGIVTVADTPAKRDVYLLDANTLAVQYASTSLNSGHYLFTGLDPDKEYLLLSRDYQRDYEPVAYDYVKPATNLTFAEQQALWQSWQNS